MPEPLTPSTRGVLFPDRLPPRFRRLEATGPVADLVAWWWISEWEGPSEQHILAFPSSNVVVEHDMVGFAGPTTRASTRVLDGSGWALGALLRPAAVPAFCDRPADLRDRYVPLPLDDLRRRVAGYDDLGAAVDEVVTWLLDRVGPLTEEAHLANRLSDVIGKNIDITSVADVAERLEVSERTVHRLAARYVGLTPYAMIRRRRLQEAAEWVRLDPSVGLAHIAAACGFTDQAHLTREFRTTLGHSPATYRTQAGGLAPTSVPEG